MHARIFFITTAVCAVVAMAIHFWPETVIERTSGVLCPDPPVQEAIAKPKPWLAHDFMITPMARYHIRARVLHRRNYFFGKESDLSPVDLAVGWGNMSDENVLGMMEISQGPRCYRWEAPGRPLPEREIIRSSANMHIIPADDAVNDALAEVYRGSIVTMDGYLVRVTDGNWRWGTSLSRNDTGDGACEVMWVESLTVEN